MPLDKSYVRGLNYYQACLLEERKYLDETLPAGSVFHQLAEAYRHDIAAEIAAADELKQSPSQFDDAQFKARGKARTARMEELAGYIYPNRNREIDVDGGKAAGDRLVGLGFSFTETTQMLARARRLKAGAPSRNHPRIVEAYQAMLAKNMSYPEVADRFCDCGQDRHDLHCADRMRKRIERLKEFLATLPAATARPGK
jgi:hypothetical protein